jgi:Spy/CpxP family protein refolding chaperone
MALFDREEKDTNRPKNRIVRLTKGLVFAIALAVGVGGAGLAFAQGPGHSKMEKWKKMSAEEKQEKLEERLDKRLQKMSDHLELTDAQQSKIRAIMEDGQTRAIEVFKGAERSERGEVRKQLHAIRKDARRQIKQVLTEEQVEKAKELREQRRQERPQRMMERLDARLDLDKTQEAQVEAIISEARDDIQQLREQAEDGERSRAMFRKHKRQVGEILKGAADDIEAVLDEEQTAEFRELRQKMRERRSQRRGR